MRLGDLDALHDIVWKWTKDEDADHAQIECFDAFLAQIEDVPTVEAVLIVHGRWINNHCSECGAPCLRFEKSRDSRLPAQPNCWNCGAKMDGGDTL